MSAPPSLPLRVLDADYSILRFDPATTLREPEGGRFLSITRTDDELSVILPTVEVATLSTPPSERSDGWRCLKVEAATMPEDVPGIIRAVVEPLADAGISVFAVASFDTDHVLVQQLERSISVLVAAGHRIARGVDSPVSAPDGRTSPADRIRCAVAADCPSLALLADAATRRLLSWTWDAKANEGQSSIEVGAEIIREDTSSPNHMSQWRVAERNGRLAGGLNSFLLPPAVAIEPTSTMSDVVRPPAELKAVAAGTWYVSVASVLPEFRGRGVGRALLDEAERLAHAAGIDRVTLLVGSFNDGAHRLYERVGFAEWERRTFVPFPGSDPQGDWILMVKELGFTKA
jgi:ribosomal protein S18 acetylase RimI-like enzyme